jgi:hypothetical protein
MLAATQIRTVNGGAKRGATSSAAGDAPLPEWKDIDCTHQPPPEDWAPKPWSGAEHDRPPQLIRTVNQLGIPGHGLSGPEDADAVADFIVQRAREGLTDVFSSPDYCTFHGGAEKWARAVAEHQTGIPYTMPAYFYDGGSQPKITRALVGSKRYPLAGQCQQSVTTALCIGGWDGGPMGDIGSGTDAHPAAARLGKGWTNVPFVLDKWSDELWEEVTVGSCLFWASGVGTGHVAMVMRKHPTQRKWQLWDTTTSFNDPTAHAAAAKSSRMLWESHWWEWIPGRISNGAWEFRGIAKVNGLGSVLEGLKPRGRCRLLLRRRSDQRLVFRSPWMSMESEGLPISWLLRSLRGAPFFDQIEPTWCVNSVNEAPTPNVPDNRPLLDIVCDANGNAKMTWTPSQGLHKRPGADWAPADAISSRGARG